MELLSQGAEAKIYLIDNNTLLKKRISKPYRLEKIDKKLLKFRTKREFKILNKLFEKDINVPAPIDIDIENYSFKFQYLKGKILVDIIDEKLLDLAFDQIIKMHNLDIVHFDLTTLNMIFFNNKIYLIDFGLALFSSSIEDKAVDLNLFFNSIKNKHNSLYYLKEKYLEKYKVNANFGFEIIKRLEKIELRGRNKLKNKG